MDFKIDINKIESDYRAKIAALEEKYSNIPQRQLKFRIWDKHSETFVDNSASLHCFSQWMIDAETGRAYIAVGAIDGDHSDNDQRSLYRDHERFSGPDGAYIIQQFTGMKDCNGKEIFEGDLLLFSNKQFISEVIYKHGCFWIHGKNFIGNDLLYEWIDSYEVIGNILEN